MNSKKIGLVVTTYNRPEYLEQCIESLKRADLSKVYYLTIVDDCSTDLKTRELINDFTRDKNGWACILSDKNEGISSSIKKGVSFMFNAGCNLVINLDGDALVRNDFIDVITQLHEQFPDRIATGFHCTTRNANGTDRHKIIEEGFDGVSYAMKESVGGINMAFNKEVYEAYVKPALEDVIANKGNWDHKACIRAAAAGKHVVCAVPSVVQHIGFDSSMNHMEQPDTADDFKDMRLKGVELVCVDCVDPVRALEAVYRSAHNIQFDKVTLFTSKDQLSKINTAATHAMGVTIVEIPKVKSKEEYSDFMIRRLWQHLTSDHCLVVQYDGYVMNWKAWDPAWLQYDWIGATWWYTDGMNVGNGGFSLRSRKLQFIVAQDRAINQTHPEDAIICRTHRKHLEQYGLKWAPDAVAKQFSIEGYNQPDQRKYNGQFGFHGSLVKFHDEIESKPVKIMNQFFGLGDILFCMTIVRDWIKQGHKVLWPVEPQYVNINKHFPEVTFVDKSIVAIDYNKEAEVSGNGYQVVPMRFTHRMLKVGMNECMKVKYDYVGTDWKRWRELTWVRDEKAEDMLFKKLGLKEGEKYILVNETFQSDNKGRVAIVPSHGTRVVKMSLVEGFTLLDWAKVIENAQEIHTVSTSIVYMLDVMELKASKVAIYIRRPQENNHDNYRNLLTKHSYIYMP